MTDSGAQTSKPWLVLQARWATVPVGNSLGTISAGSDYGALIYKLNDNYGSAIIHGYNFTMYRVIFNAGAMTYYAINQTAGS